jgi:hypothetical protein
MGKKSNSSEGFTKKAFAVLVNTDLTEGRGFMVVKAICAVEATAKRLAIGASTQGTNGTIEEVELIQHNQRWYGPVNIEYPSKKDEELQRTLDAARTAERKALALGMTADDLAALRKPYY